MMRHVSMLNKRVFPSTQEDEILLTRTLHGIMSEFDASTSRDGLELVR